MFLYVRFCTHTHGSLCPICMHHMPVYDFGVWLRVYVRSWQPTCSSNLAEYLLIWHRKKGGRPIARDYTDLHTHTYTHLLAHICTLRNAKPHAFSHTRAYLGWLAHSDTRISVSLNLLASIVVRKSFKRSSVLQKENRSRQKVLYVTP